jgi:hypothetical protein
MVIPDLGGLGNHVIARSRHLLTAPYKRSTARPGRLRRGLAARIGVNCRVSVDISLQYVFYPVFYHKKRV